MGKKIWIIALATMLLPTLTRGQVKLNVDTLECHVIGFSAGILTPGTGTTTSGLAGGNMRDLYKPPYLDFSLNCDYKYLSNWLVTLDADLWFGLTSDNLQRRNERMPSVYQPDGTAYGWGGTDGYLTAYNRSLSVRPGVGKIITVTPKNPNSGILLKLSGGWMMQKTVFHQDYTESPVPQINGDKSKLFDHLRHGAILTESIGYVFMSNYSTYVNVKVELQVSQCWSWSTRPWVLDDLMGLNGKDNGRYFDLLYGVKLSWMFPLMGKTTYDYYYY